MQDIDIRELISKINSQEALIEQLRLTSVNDKEKYEQLINQEKDRVLSLRAAFRSSTESSAAAFEDMKDNIETLRAQLDKKRTRIYNLEIELNENYSRIENGAQIPNNNSNNNLIGLSPENASGELLNTINNLKFELQNERNLVADLKLQIELEKRNLITHHHHSYQEIPRILDNTSFSPASNDISLGSADKFKLLSPIPFSDVNKALISSIIESERNNIKELKKEIHKHQNNGKSSMYVDGYLDAWKVQLDEKMKQNSNHIAGGAMNDFDAAQTSSECVPIQDDKIVSSPPMKDDSKGLIKGFLSTENNSVVVFPDSNANDVDQYTPLKLKPEYSEIESCKKDEKIIFLETQVKDLDAKILELHETNKDMSSQITSLELELDASKLQLEIGENDLNKLKEQYLLIANTSDEVGSLKNDIKTLTSESTQHQQIIKELTELNTSYVQENSDLKTQLQENDKLNFEKDEKIKLLKLTIEASSIDLSNLQSEFENEKILLTNVSQEKDLTISNKESEVSSLKSQLEDEKTKHEVLLSTYNKNISELDLLNSKIQENQLTISEIQKSYDKLKNELETRNAEMVDQSQKSSDHIQELTTKLNDSEYQISTLCDNLQESQKKLKLLHSENKSLEVKINTDQDMINTLNQNLDSKNLELVSLSENINRLEIEKSSFLSQVNNISEEKKRLEADIDTLNITINAKDTEIFDLNEKMSKITVDLDNKNNLISDMRFQISESKKTNDEIKASGMNKINSLQAELEAQRTSYEGTFETLKNNESNLLFKIESANKEIDYFNSKLFSLELEKRNFEEQIEKTENEKFNLKKLVDEKSEKVSDLEARLVNLNSELATTKDILDASVANDFESVKFLQETSDNLKNSLKIKEQEAEELRQVHKSTLASLLYYKDKLEGSNDSAYNSPVNSPVNKSLNFDTQSDLISSAEKIAKLEKMNAELSKENKKLNDLVSALDYNVTCLTNYSHTICATKYKLEDEIKLLSAKKEKESDVYMETPSEAILEDLAQTKKELSSTKKKLAVLYETINSPSTPASLKQDEYNLTLELNKYLPLDSNAKSFQLQSGFSWDKGIKALNFGSTPGPKISESFLDQSLMSNMSDISLTNLLSPGPGFICDIDKINSEEEDKYNKLSSENENLKKQLKNQSELVSALEYQVSSLENLSHSNIDAKIKFEKECESLRNKNKSLQIDLEQTLEIIDKMKLDGLSGQDTLKIFTQRHLLENDLHEARLFINSLLEKQNQIEAKLQPLANVPAIRYELPMLYQSPSPSSDINRTTSTPSSSRSTPLTVQKSVSFREESPFSEINRTMSTPSSSKSTPLAVQKSVIFKEDLIKENLTSKGQDWAPLNVSLDFNNLGEESMRNDLSLLNNEKVVTKVEQGTNVELNDTIVDKSLNDTIESLQQEYKKAVEDIKIQKELSSKFEKSHSSYAEIVSSLDSRVAHVESVIGSNESTPVVFDKTAVSSYFPSESTPSPQSAPQLISTSTAIKKSFASVIKERVLPAMSFFRTPKPSVNKMKSTPRNDDDYLDFL